MRRVTVIFEDEHVMHVRKPRNEFKEGDVVRVKYQDGHSALFTVQHEEYISTCSKCCLDGTEHKCFGYKEGDIEYCLAGASNYFKSFDEILENI